MSPRDPLDAVPVVSDGVSSSTPPSGEGLLLRRRLPARGRFAAWVERRFRLERTLSFELDALGARFFSRIDGARSLRDIQAVLRAEGVPEGQSRDAVVAFTKTLMERRLVALRVEPHAR